MADGVGLSVGATNLTAVAVGRAAVTRSAVVTLFPNRPLEVGVPGENPRLNSDERGLVITDFVDRVGDPVGIVAPDGTTHRGEVLLAEALREMLYEVTNGRGSRGPGRGDASGALACRPRWTRCAARCPRCASSPRSALVSDAESGRHGAAR